MKAGRRAITLLLALACASVGLSGCSRAQQPFRRQEILMGTYVAQTVYGDQAQAAAQAVSDEIARLEQIFSATRDNSELARVNRAAGNGEWISVSDEFVALLELSQQVSDESDGALDVTLGRLVSLWGIGTDHAAVPDANELRLALLHTGADKVELDRQSSAVRITDAKMALDFGAIAKGYAADRAASLYRTHGVSSAVLTLGGNTYAVGARPDGSAFKVGIRNPDGDAQSIIGYLEAENTSVVTSGDYERYFEQDGTRYHHILNPSTGTPARSGLVSCTITGESSALCDALSTAVFVLGEERGRNLLAHYDGYGCVFIRPDHTIGITENLRGRFVFQDESGAYRFDVK